MTDQDLEAIVGGYHGDSFAVLGPHALTEDADGPWVVRAFLPQVKEVAVRSGDRLQDAGENSLVQ